MGKAQCSRRSPRCRNRIAPWASIMRSQSQRTGPLTEALVRDARICQGRQDRLLFPKRAEVQNKVRYFRLHARGDLDEGGMWPTAFALKELTADDEAKIGAS